MIREIALFWGLERHFCHEKRSSKKKSPVGCREPLAVAPLFLTLKMAV
jgi:hypothetical protein